MKHVFWIHSHTLYLTALGVINTLHLPQEDVIFLLREHYKFYNMPDEISIYDLSDIDDILLWKDTQESLSKKIKQLDKFIEEKIGEEYTFYIPHLMAKLWQVIATNKLCSDIKFVQEGIIDSCTGDGRNKKRVLKTLFSKIFIRNLGRVWKTYPHGWDFRPLGVPRISESFAISIGLFSKLNCKHTIISWPKSESPLKLREDGTYFVFESLIEQKFIERNIFMQATENMIKKYAGTYNYVKFHPVQEQENKKYIKSLFSKYGYTVEVLPDDVPFEIILASQPHMKVCGFTSSLIFFAALMPQHEAHICVEALYASKKFVKNYWETFKKNLIRCYGNKFEFDSFTMNSPVTRAMIAHTLSDLSYARIDIKNEGSNDNDVDIVDISDPTAEITAPNWIHKKGNGRVLKSKSGALSMKLKCKGDGKLTINLLAADFREENNTRVPVWVHYTKFIVGDQIVFDSVRPAWHNQRQKLTLDSKDGEIVNVHVEWVPDCITFGSGMKQVYNIQENTLKAVKARDVNNASYARIDIKNNGTNENDIEILEVADRTAQVNSPKWLQKNGNGRVIKSNSGNLSLKIKCMGDGILNIALRGPDIRDAENKRTPIWIDYKKFIVDDSILFESIKPAWHGKPHKFDMNVKDSQVVNIHVEWKENYATIGSVNT